MVAVGFYQVLDRMRRGINISIVLMICAFLWKCTEIKETDPVEFDTIYFPLEVGSVHVYQVSGVRYNSVQDSTEFSYLLKESVVDSFQNLESGISYKIQRQKKLNEAEPWVMDSIWTARMDGNGAVRVENNVPTVKLTFPLKENKTWDGNKLNEKREDEFEMVNVKQPFSTSVGSYEKTVTVIQEELPDYIVKFIFQKEVYAEGTGLVYKEYIILEYDQKNGQQTVESGIRYYQRLIEYEEE